MFLRHAVEIVFVVEKRLSFAGGTYKSPITGLPTPIEIGSVMLDSNTDRPVPIISIAMDQEGKVLPVSHVCACLIGWERAVLVRYSRRSVLLSLSVFFIISVYSASSRKCLLSMQGVLLAFGI